MVSQVIAVTGIRKSYGPTVAVDDVSFDVNEGGDLRTDRAQRRRQDDDDGVRGGSAHGRIAGRSRCSGLDPVRDVYQLQDRIGVQLQEAQLQKRIKVWEAVDLWASLYRTAGRRRPAARTARARRQARTPGS